MELKRKQLGKLSSMDAAQQEGNGQTAVRVSIVSIAGNSLLSLFKLLAGIFAHSGAMISDAVHSASDVLSSVIVIIGVKLAGREADRDHPYGHERFECVAAIVLSVILLVTGLFIGHTAVQRSHFRQHSKLFGLKSTSCISPTLI